MTNKKLSFNPEEKLISVKGSRGEKNYLEVKYRVQILRELYPDAKIETQIMHLDVEEGIAAVFARIELPGGAVGTGMKQESRRDFNDFLEKAETGAIGRACAAVGIGIQYAHDYEYESESPKDYKGVDSPVDVPTPKSSSRKAEEVASSFTSTTQAVLPNKSDTTLGKLKTELAKQVARIGREPIIAHMKASFNVEETAKLSVQQFAELVEWAKQQESDHV